MHWLRSLCVILAATGTVAGTTAALAQDYPTKPIRLMIPTAAGGLMDVAARIAADHLGKALGQRLVIENRPGSGGNLGVEAVVKAEPDGYTLGLIQIGNVAINPYVYPDMPFDPLTDLIPVAPVTSSAILVVAGAEVPANNLKELIALAKKEPGKLAYGSAGPRHRAASRWRDVQVDGRRRHPARALSRRGPGGERHDRRPCSAHLCRLGRGARPGRGRPPEGPGGGAAASGSQAAPQLPTRRRPAARL